MKKFRTVCLALFFTISCLLAGCAETGSIKESDITGKTYTYQKDGFGGDFTITIMDDGTFSYYEGLLSSYIGMGNWTLDGDILHLSDTESQTKTRNYYFHVDGSDLVFISENSDSFSYIDVADGEQFSSQDTHYCY